MYKPNFCAECGERVLRARWRAWTSRRYCASCAVRFRRGWRAPLALACALVLAGFVVGRWTRPAPPPLTIERGALPLPALIAKGATVQPNGATKPADVDDAATESATANGVTNGVGATRAGLGVAAEELPTDPNEVISICGARTKKGTPCQRRVRGTGRCWQHRGLPAMLPPEKLIVRN